MPDTGIHVTLADYAIGGVEKILLENLSYPEKEGKVGITSREQRILEKIGGATGYSGRIDFPGRLLAMQGPFGRPACRAPI